MREIIGKVFKLYLAEIEKGNPPPLPPPRCENGCAVM
jgi:hypothetical protein